MSSILHHHQQRCRRADPDVLTLYHKHMNGNVDSGPTKNWLDVLEEQIINFLGKTFCIKGLPDKSNNSQKFLERCMEASNAKDPNPALFTVAQMVNMLSEPYLCEVLPMMSNLIFLSRHNQDFCSPKVKTENAKKILKRLQEMISSPTYLSISNPRARLRRLMDVVDSIRKYSEYLLRMSGYTRSMGRSPRAILKDINLSRSRSTV